MKNNSRIYNKIVDVSSLGSILPGCSLLEIVSNNRILLERHKGICKYTRDQICVKCDFGVVEVYGTDLYIKNMSYDQLLVSGKIDSIHLCRCESK